jgi:threonine synthase
MRSGGWSRPARSTGCRASTPSRPPLPPRSTPRTRPAPTTSPESTRAGPSPSLPQRGTALASEEEILAAQADLAAEGLYVEPTAALTLAAARTLLAAGHLRADETNVVMLGGSGLKAGSK